MIGCETVKCCKSKIGCRSEVMKTHAHKYGWLKLNGRYYCPKHAKEVQGGHHNRSGRSLKGD